MDKHPRLRSVGVGETFSCITGKLVMSAVREDTISSVGILQVRAGHNADYEAPVHAMHSIFEEENTNAVPLVEAGNAFNTVEWKGISS